MHELIRDGAALGFVDTGKGAPPLVLIHEVGCDQSSFLPQIEHFSASHRVVSVDLRGHGRSSGLDEECTITSLADDVAWLCYELGLYAPVLVGHGLGGMVCVELAARRPDLAAAIVTLDAPIPLSPRLRSFAESFLKFSSGLSETAFRATLRALLSNMLPRDAARRFTDPVLWGTSRVSRRAATSAWKGALEWDAQRALSGCNVPLLHVDSGFGTSGGPGLGDLYPRLRTATTGSPNHFAHIREHEQVNEAIESFLRGLETT